ncbi:MAG: hypothetical protein WBL80_07395 [Erysipelotrichaceae bacterium]
MNKFSNTSPLYPFPAEEKSFVFEYFYPRLQDHDEYAMNSFHAQIKDQSMELLNEIFYVPFADKLVVTVSECKHSMDVYKIERYQATYDKLMANQAESIFTLTNELSADARKITAQSYAFLGSYPYEKLNQAYLMKL